MTLPVLTERLVVREYTMSDLDDVLAVIGDARVFWWRARPYGRVGARAWLDEAITFAREHDIGRYAVQLRDSAAGPSAYRGRVIGGVSLLPREFDGRVEVEIGWHMAGDLWGRGYATEAGAALMREARRRGLRRLVSFIMPGNVQSRRVAEKLGLRLEGEVQWASRPHELWRVELGARQESGATSSRAGKYVR